MKMLLNIEVNCSIRNFESKINSATSQSRLEENFVNLSMSILSYLIVLNSRRPSEVAYAQNWNHEKLQTKGDLAVFSMVATKKSTRVPIIFPIHIRLAIIETLLSHRQQLNIRGDLLFPKLNWFSVQWFRCVNRI